MNDGSRHFGDVPEIVFFDAMREHLKRLNGASETEFISDMVTEMWMDFEYKDNKFSINNQMGEYWFFVENPDCPDAILTEVVEHFESVNPR